MNFTERDRRALLEELFPKEGKGKSVTLQDALEAVHCAKEARERRRQLCAGAGMAALVAALGLLTTREIPAPSEGETGREVASTASVVPQRVSQPFQVERVDDEGLLNLLDETPTALVRWPDGSRTLMLVVQTSPAG